MLGTLLRPPLLIFKNQLTRGDQKEAKRLIIFSIVSFLIMLCIFVGFIAVLTSVENSPLFVTLVPTKIIELVFYAFFLLLLISTTAATIGNSYTSQRMDLLLSLPISTPKLFFAKLIETLLETGTMYFVFFLPALAAYIVVFSLPWTFVLTGVLISFPFLLIPAGLSFVTATVFVKFSSIIWKRGLFFLIVVGLVISWLLTRLSSLVLTVRTEKAGTNAIVRMISLFDNPNPYWFPSRWAADILSSFLAPTFSNTTLCVLLLAAGALGAVSLGYLVFDLFFFTIRSSSQSQQKTKKVTLDTTRRIVEGFIGYFPLRQQLRAVMIKDLTSLVRDRAQALHLLLFLGISSIYIVIFSFMTVMLDMPLLAQQSWYATLATLNVIFSAIILITIMTRLVYPAMSLEGSAFWILSVAPIELRELVRAKFLCWLPLTLLIVITLLFAGGLAIGLPVQAHILTFVIAVSLGIGFTGLAIGIGSIFASFEWESPSKLSAGFGTLVLMLATLCLIVVTSLPAGAALSLSIIPRLRDNVGEGGSAILMTVSVFLVIFVNIYSAHWACTKGADVLERDTSKMKLL